MKENSWLLTTNYSTNLTNHLLVIFASYGYLAVTSPWLQETIQSMAHKKVLPNSNNASIPHNKLQATIELSKPVDRQKQAQK